MDLMVGPDGSVRHSYNAGFVVLSYLVSLAGCCTALELLHRRTGARGIYNWYLLLAAASSMGAVAIWSMHFIGNRAIIMDRGQPSAEIQYSPGWTAASFFVPTVVIGIAFFIYNIREKSSCAAIAFGGVLTGTSVCGMHFMGQGGIANYAPRYLWYYVVGSALIAICATTITLGTFFYFKSHWTDNWWKRSLLASFLAAAVSAMHWVATAGTIYRAKEYHVQATRGLSRRTTVIVVINLCMGCCAALITLAIIGRRSRSRSADRARQVVLACAIFDPDGGIMVTPEGLLPCRKITDSYIERSLEDIFDVDHPVFCWIFRASRCWRTVADLVPGMRSHLRHAIPREPFSPSDASESRTSSDMGKSSDYSTLFKENFCVAAKDLADLIQEPLEDIGVLYGGIMNTGTLSKAAKLKYHGLKIRNKTIEAAERGESPIVFGRGQLLFLVRQANRAESSRLQAVGHRFAAMPNVIGSLARSMEVTCEELIPQLESMRDSASDEHLLAPGVHLAYFAIRPVLRRGFDILVRKDASNLIPTIPFRKSKLEQWQLDILSGMNNLTVATCCDMLGEKTKLEYKREQKFADELLKGILQLAEIVGDPFFLEARLVARPLMAPCSPSNKYGSQQQALLITFSNMIDAHQNNATNARLHFAPMKLFVCQQRAYKGCPDNGFFAKKIYEEFAALVEPSDDHYHRVSADGPHYRNRSSIDTFQSMSDASPSPAKKKTWPSRVHVKGFDVHNDNSSAKHLVSPGSVKLYGGINVSSEIDIDISEVSRESHGCDIEMKKLGGASELVVADTEVETFADVLVHITVNDRKKQPAVAL